MVKIPPNILTLSLTLTDFYKTLSLTNSEYFCPTYRAGSPDCWSSVLKSNRNWIFNIPLCSTLKTIRLHLDYLLLS